MQDGQQKGGCLATAGLAGDHEVVNDRALRFTSRCTHGQRDHACLHSGGLGVAEIIHGLDQRVDQTQLYKQVIGFWACFSSICYGFDSCLRAFHMG
jgi:hypothetical protein